jgi:hypothetical protein
VLQEDAVSPDYECPDADRKRRHDTTGAEQFMPPTTSKYSEQFKRWKLKGEFLGVY